MSISKLLRKPVPLWLLLVLVVASFGVLAGVLIIPTYFPVKGDFALQTPSSTVFLPINHTISVKFTVKSMQNFTGVVRFNLLSSSNLNATTGPGVLLSFDPVLNRVFNQSYSFSVSSNRPGNDTLVLTGTSAGKSHSLNFSVIVQGLAFQASPTQLVVTQHSSANMTVTLKSLNSYSGNLTLAIGAQDLWITLFSTTLNCSSCNGLGAPYPLSPNGTVGVIINVRWQGNGADTPGSVGQMTLEVDGLFDQTFTVLWN